MKRVVIADDLTGASDAGVQFAKAGDRTTVWLDAAAALDDRESDVVVVDMDSRAAEPRDAYAALRDFVVRLGPRPPEQIIKKIDSTLRGNVAAELRALLDTLPTAFAVVCPAYPANRRTCRGGMLYVDGIPVDATDFARDPVSPVRDARIAVHLGVPSAAIDLATLRAGPGALAGAIARARSDGARAAVVDAESEADLRAVAALNASHEDLLWLGSTGLIEFLAGAGTGSGASAAPVVSRASAPVTLRAAGPVVLLVGSLSEMTQRQISTFALDPHVHTELLDPAVLLDGVEPLARALGHAAGAVARGVDTLIALDGASDRSLDALDLRTRLAATLDGIVSSDGGSTVLLSGGDCARAFCERRGIRGMTVLAELAPGIPISRAIGADLFIVTKAGGFGDPETYRELVAALHAGTAA